MCTRRRRSGRGPSSCWRRYPGTSPSGAWPPGDQNPAALIFPTHDGDDWKLHDWQNWRRRIYQPAARKAGVTGDLRAYRLRGSFVSPDLGEGRSLAFVADQAGHSVGAERRTPTRLHTDRFGDDWTMVVYILPVQ